MSRGDWLLVGGVSASVGTALTALLAEALAEDFGERVLLVGPAAAVAQPSASLCLEAFPEGPNPVSALWALVSRKGGDFDRVLIDPADREQRTAIMPATDQLVHVSRETFATLPNVAPGCRLTFVGLLPEAHADYDPHLFRAGTCRASITLKNLGKRSRRSELDALEIDFVNRLSRAVSGRRVGLALGGGGAWGFAHIALIEAMVERGIPIDMVSGVSFGAIVGALYCSGGPRALVRLVEDSTALAVAIWLSTIHSGTIERFVDRRVPQKWLERLPLPFVPLATHVETGEPDALRVGSVGRAVRASGSLPGLIGPTLIGGVRYVDGGISCNVPASLLPAEGAGLVIASNVMQRATTARRVPHTRFLGARALASQLNPVERAKDLILSMSTLTHNGGALTAANAHVTYQAYGSAYAPWDFHRGPEIYEQARDDVELTVDRIEHAWIALARTVQ